MITIARTRHARLAAAAAVLGIVAIGCLPSSSRGSAGSTGAPDGQGSGSAASVAPTGPTGPTPRPSFVPPTPTPAPTFLVHVVAAGESLTTIARLYGTTPRSIAFWNRATYPSLDPESPGYSPNLLKVGWTLQIIPRHIVDAEGELAPSPDPAASGG